MTPLLHNSLCTTRYIDSYSHIQTCPQTCYNKTMTSEDTQIQTTQAELVAPQPQSTETQQIGYLKDQIAALSTHLSDLTHEIMVIKHELSELRSGSQNPDKPILENTDKEVQNMHLEQNNTSELLSVSKPSDTPIEEPPAELDIPVETTSAPGVSASTPVEEPPAELEIPVQNAPAPVEIKQNRAPITLTAEQAATLQFPMLVGTANATTLTFSIAA